MKRERQELILQMLKDRGILKITDLVPHFSNSLMTLRRDLDELEARGELTRVHGGAVLTKENNGNVFQPSFQRRMEDNLKEKQRICKKAAELVNPGDILFLDAGSTPYIMLEYLDKNIPLTIITPGLFTATRASALPLASVICIGGDTHKSSYSSVGTSAIERIGQFHAHKAFISTKAFSFPSGCYEADMQLIEIKKAIVKASEKTILLADYTKINSKSLSPSVAVSELDTVITNENADPETINEMKLKKLNVILV